MRTHLAVRRRAARFSRLPLGIASLLAFALTCQDVTVTPVAVRNVEIDPDELTLTIGEERQLSAIVTDEAGRRLDRSVTWSTQHDDIVSVDAETGEIVALSGGEASVTAAVDGRSGTATVHVTGAPGEPGEKVETVHVDPDEVSLQVGGTFQLEAIARSVGGVILAGRVVTWSSSDATVASVDAEGVVTGVAAGEVEITATIEGIDGTAEVMVAAEAEPVATVSVDPDEVSLGVGSTVEFEAIPRSLRGAVLTGREVTWSSTDPAVASVDDDGVVTGVAAGEATITATIEGIAGTAEVMVAAEAEPVSTVEVDPGEVDLPVGGTVALEAIARSAGDVILSGRQVTWSSTDAAVASINDEGVVTGVAAGAATITATIDGVDGHAQITVSPVPVATVEVDPPDASIVVGETVQLNATALNEDGEPVEGRTATWESDDPAIASIDANGLVTGEAAGGATITATIDGVTDNAQITVSLVPVATVEVDPAESSILIGETVQLNATALDEDGEPLEGRAVTWESDDPTIASVDANGLVTGETAGGATITATIDGVTDNAQITVSLVPVATVEVDPAESSILIGETVQLNATALDEDGEPLEGRAVTWESDDPTIASVDANGLVTGETAGGATITATIEGVTDNAQITVSLVPVATVEVDPAESSILIGETVQLNATALDEDGEPLEGRAVTWESDNPAVASVDANGLVTGEAAGGATITATIEGVEDNAQVTVSPEPVATVEVDPPDASIVVGETVQLNATALDDDGTPLEGRAVTWESNDPAVASVDANGLVTGEAEGGATIEATIEGVADNAQITVSPVPVATVAVDPPEASLFLGGTVQLSATALDEDGDPLEGRAVTWESSNGLVASVDANGLVTALLPGQATIRATIEGVIGEATITVALIPVETVELQPAEPSIVVGETVQLVATARAAGGDVIEGRPVSWMSDNVAVATVDAVGVVKGEAPGEAAVMATIEGKSDIASIMVDPIPVESIIVSPASVNMNILSPLNPAVFTADVSGHDTPLPGRLVTWGVTSGPGLEPCPGVSSSTNASVALTPLSGTTDINGRSQTTATVNVLPLPDPGTAIVYATAEGKVGCARIEVSVL